MGNAKTTTTRVYQPVTGLIDTIDTGNGNSNDNIQQLGFDFDALGNLTQRTGREQQQNDPLSESFGYDNLNRLTSAQVSGESQKSVSYDALGNLTFKTGVGNYTYGQNNAGPHAVTRTSTGSKNYTYDDNGNMLTGDDRNITWSSYNKPIHITKGSSSSSFVYGTNRNRIRQVNDDKTIYYVNGLFEQEESYGDITAVHYIKAGGSTIAIVKSKDSGAKETRYLHKDHLGGIEAITDENGSLVQQLSYDPHGKRRNTDWTDSVAQIPVYDTQRGFTGHEHLDDVGLIHMNGRVYDPTLGRFLSADPFVQFPDNLQSLNRYSYVLNNPLSYTDPSGFGLFSFLKNIFKNKIFRFVAAIVLAAVTYGAVYGALATTFGTAAAGGAITVSVGVVTASTASIIAGAAAGFVGGFVGSGGNLSAALQGSVVGGFSGYIGASGGALASRTAKAVAHGVVGGAQAAVNGGKFLRGFASSFFTKKVSGRISGSDTFEDNNVGGAVAAAVVGGTASVIGGGKFANGAYTTAFQYLFNQGSRGRSRSVPRGKPITAQNVSESLDKISDVSAALSLTVLLTPAAPVASTIFGAISIVAKGIKISVDYLNGYSESSYSNEQDVLELGLSSATFYGSSVIESISLKDFGRLTPLGRVTSGFLEGFNYFPSIMKSHIDDNR